MSGLPEMLGTITPARLTLARAGASPATAERLRFAADHALARDAVRRELDGAGLLAALAERGIRGALVRSRATNVAEHLRHPERGRQLLGADRVALGPPREIAFVVSDGLSAGAVERYAPSFLHALGGVEWAAVVRHGRVAIGDEIGEALEAELVVVLIGERPGLSAPESLGAYITYEPRIGRTDAERLCISNIRDGGAPPETAAAQLRDMIANALRDRKTGI